MIGFIILVLLVLLAVIILVKMKKDRNKLPDEKNYVEPEISEIIDEDK